MSEPGTHTRTSTEAGPDFCLQCSDSIQEWIPWPCPDAEVAELEHQVCLDRWSKLSDLDRAGTTFHGADAHLPRTDT